MTVEAIFAMCITMIGLLATTYGGYVIGRTRQLDEWMKESDRQAQEIRNSIARRKETKP